MILTDDERRMLDGDEGPAAKAAITNTRACGAASRGTTTAPASVNSLPGP